MGIFDELKLSLFGIIWRGLLLAFALRFHSILGAGTKVIIAFLVVDCVFLLLGTKGISGFVARGVSLFLFLLLFLYPHAVWFESWEASLSGWRYALQHPQAPMYAYPNMFLEFFDIEKALISALPQALKQEWKKAEAKAKWKQKVLGKTKEGVKIKINEEYVTLFFWLFFLILALARYRLPVWIDFVNIFTGVCAAWALFVHFYQQLPGPLFFLPGVALLFLMWIAKRILLLVWREADPLRHHLDFLSELQQRFLLEFYTPLPDAVRTEIEKSRHLDFAIRNVFSTYTPVLLFVCLRAPSELSVAGAVWSFVFYAFAVKKWGASSYVRKMLMDVVRTEFFVSSLISAFVISLLVIAKLKLYWIAGGAVLYPVAIGIIFLSVLVRDRTHDEKSLYTALLQDALAKAKRKGIPKKYLPICVVIIVPFFFIGCSSPRRVSYFGSPYEGDIVKDCIQRLSPEEQYAFEVKTYEKTGVLVKSCWESKNEACKGVKAGVEVVLARKGAHFRKGDVVVGISTQKPLWGWGKWKSRWYVPFDACSFYVASQHATKFLIFRRIGKIRLQVEIVYSPPAPVVVGNYALGLPQGRPYAAWKGGWGILLPIREETGWNLQELDTVTQFLLLRGEKEEFLPANRRFANYWYHDDCAKTYYRGVKNVAGANLLAPATDAPAAGAVFTVGLFSLCGGLQPYKSKFPLRNVSRLLHRARGILVVLNRGKVLDPGDVLIKKGGLYEVWRLIEVVP